MRTSRIAVAAILVLTLALPAAAPFLGLAVRPAAWSVWGDASRIGHLVLDTALLAVGAILLSVPVGTVFGIAYARIPFFGRRAVSFPILVAMFVPLPVYAVAWQVVGADWLPLVIPGGTAGRPWAQGLLPAVFIHAAAAVPWVAWIVATAMSAADPGLEETAIVSGGPGDLVRRVWVPRAVPAAACGAAWVAVQCATEISVTDVMLVRTVAEEAYTQLVVGYAAGASAAAAVTLPILVIAVAAGSYLLRRLDRSFPAAADDTGMSPSFPWSPATRWGTAVAVWASVAAFAGLPLAAIVWKAAGGGREAEAGIDRLFRTLGRVARTDGAVLGESLLAAAGAGLIAAAVAWAACGLAVRSRWLSRLLLVLCVGIWLTPGPLVGFGLKQVFEVMMSCEDLVFRAVPWHPEFPPVRSLVYDQPSPVPVVWAAVVRLFPYAVAVVWPAVRSVPPGLSDLAAVDGLGPVAFFRRVLAPAAGTAFAPAALAVAALALGEVAAAKIVAPPGYRVYVLDLFAQMHYGTDATVCGLCLLQLLTTAIAIAVVRVIRSRGSRRMMSTAPSRPPDRPLRPE